VQLSLLQHFCWSLDLISEEDWTRQTQPQPTKLSRDVDPKEMTLLGFACRWKRRATFRRNPLVLNSHALPEGKSGLLSHACMLADKGAAAPRQ
jgi:hypothetical protein